MLVCHPASLGKPPNDWPPVLQKSTLWPEAMEREDPPCPCMFVIYEADYEARKKRIIDSPKNTDDAKTRKQGRITAGDMAKAMELDDQVDKVISSLKRKRDLKEDEASSTNGVAVVQKP